MGEIIQKRRRKAKGTTGMFPKTKSLSNLLRKTRKSAKMIKRKEMKTGKSLRNKNGHE